MGDHRGLGLAPSSSLSLLGRGFAEIGAGGGSASVSVSVVSWGCGGEGGRGATAGGGSMEFAAGVVGREIEKLPLVVFVSDLNPLTRGSSGVQGNLCHVATLSSSDFYWDNEFIFFENEVKPDVDE